MKKIMLLGIIAVTFLAGTVLSATFDMAIAVSPYCQDMIPKGKPFGDIWTAICDLHNQQDSQIASLQAQINDLQPGPNPIVCPPPGAVLGGTSNTAARLPLTNLSGCNLSGLDMHSVDLRYSNLENTNLSGTDFTGALLTGVRLDGAHGTCVGHPICATLPP